MADPVKCKKCKGAKPRQKQPPCVACNGSGKVIVGVDESGKTVITAVQS